MNKQLIKDTLGWGLVLWVIGYILGIVLFFAVPASLLGWIIMPIGIIITLWVLYKKINSKSLQYYFILGAVWMLIAIFLDYLLIVKAFNPVEGYYKLDVYLYYVLTFLLPAFVGWRKSSV